MLSLFDLSATGLYSTASIFAQSIVALLAFGAFLAIWRMDKLHAGVELPTRNLVQAISQCRGVKVAYEDPNRGRDIIPVWAWFERRGCPIPEVSYTDPVVVPHAVVEAARHMMSRREEVEQLELKQAHSADDPYGFKSLEKKLSAVHPVADLIGNIDRWLKSMSVLGLAGFGLAMIVAGSVEVLVALPEWMGWAVVGSFIALVVGTGISAALLARYCFARV